MDAGQTETENLSMPPYGRPIPSLGVVVNFAHFLGCEEAIMVLGLGSTNPTRICSAGYGNNLGWIYPQSQPLISDAMIRLLSKKCLRKDSGDLDGDCAPKKVSLFHPF